MRAQAHQRTNAKYSGKAPLLIDAWRSSYEKLFEDKPSWDPFLCCVTTDKSHKRNNIVGGDLQKKNSYTNV